MKSLRVMPRLFGVPLCGGLGVGGAEEDSAYACNSCHMNLLGLLESIEELGDGTAVDGGGRQLDAVAEVGGEAADY